MLTAFSLCTYPDDPQPLLQDTRSRCDALQNAAWRALEHIRHPAVRDSALDNVNRGIRTPENFAILMKKYVSEDAQLLEDLLRESITVSDWGNVHAAGLTLIRAFSQGSKIPRPKQILPLLYVYNPCSFCRESVVKYMAKHRMLTPQLLEECLYDSNNDLRRYAAKRLR